MFLNVWCTMILLFRIGELNAGGGGETFLNKYIAEIDYKTVPSDTGSIRTKGLESVSVETGVCSRFMMSLYDRRGLWEYKGNTWFCVMSSI